MKPALTAAGTAVLTAVLAAVLTGTLVASVTSSPALARRLPAPGGKVTLSLPPALTAATMDAHLHVPVVEPAFDVDAAMALAHPALPGFPMWRSSVLTQLVRDDARTWRLTAAAPAAAVAESLARCFLHDGASWPGAVLHARRVTVVVTVAASDVLLRFSSSVGLLPELLAGCALRAAGPSGSSGSYVVVGPGVLAWRGGSFGPPGLPGLIELVGPGARAHVAAGGAEGPETATLRAPFADVVLLVPSPQARRRDPLGLLDARAGRRAFERALRADLLAAAYGQGRGAPTESILPPGLAPARPLPKPSAGPPAAPLSLAPLPSTAPRLLVARDEDDALVQGVVERLAVILRNRGTLMELVPGRRSVEADSEGGVRVLRWRAPSRDPALALLALAGAHPHLLEVEEARQALADPRLLSDSREERITAALALERAWIEAVAVVPLLVVDRWFVVDHELRGVQIREDGVPLLHGAAFLHGAAALPGSAAVVGAR